VNWAEWNGKFRDCVRRFVKGDEGQINELGWRITGSADLFGDDGRTSDASVNFVTCHDGFTLHDLVSYNGKHNEANGEDNRDGYNDNQSWNCGAEGETGDEAVLALRRRQAKNFACLLLFSQGVPMIAHGDEFLRTQKGNNNVYCQDNPLAWMDWGLAGTNADMLAFWRKAIALRKRLPLLMGKRFLTGEDKDRNEVPDIAWFGPEGKDLDWNRPDGRSLAFQLDGYDDEGRNGAGREGGPSRSEPGRYYFLFNAAATETEFRLPPLLESQAWHRVADTSLPAGEDFVDTSKAGPLMDPFSYRAKPYSAAILASRTRSP
jgi:glycogen operon protein